MKKKNGITKGKITQIKSKKPKLAKRKLGMGLSSLLSTDSALDSIISKKTGDKETNSDLGNSIQKVADKIKVVSNSNTSIPTQTVESQQIKLLFIAWFLANISQEKHLTRPS